MHSNNKNNITTTITHHIKYTHVRTDTLARQVYSLHDSSGNEKEVSSGEETKQTTATIKIFFNTKRKRSRIQSESKQPYGREHNFFYARKQLR